MSIQEKLYEKLSAEFESFSADLKQKTAEEIIEKAYEITYKQEIMMCVESGNFSNEKANLLLNLKNPLDEIYRDWLDCDVSICDSLHDCIDNVAER